jgi:hypothetical protein
MGVRYSVAANSSLYLVVADCVSLYQAVFTGAVIDETTGKPVVYTPVMNVDMRGITLRVTEDALIAGAAVLSEVFPENATKAYNFTLTLSAIGYRAVTVPVAVPIASTFPLVLPAIVMRRIPVRLQGRVVKASDRSAVANATISNKPATQLLLRDPLRFAHASGTSVRSVALSNSGAPATLSNAVVAGSSTLTLSTNAGLAAGTLVQIGGVNGAIYPVASVGPGAVRVTLGELVTLSSPVGATVQAVTASAPVGASTLARSADAGDGLVMLRAALTGSAIQIFDGARTEYHSLNVLSDADGYFRVDGITGVQALDLLCSAPTFTTLDQPWTPNYSQPASIVDFLLRP